MQTMTFMNLLMGILAAESGQAGHCAQGEVAEF